MKSRSAYFLVLEVVVEDSMGEDTRRVAYNIAWGNSIHIRSLSAADTGCRTQGDLR